MRNRSNTKIQETMGKEKKKIKENKPSQQEKRY